MAYSESEEEEVADSANSCSSRKNERKEGVKRGFISHPLLFSFLTFLMSGESNCRLVRNNSDSESKGSEMRGERTFFRLLQESRVETEAGRLKCPQDRAKSKALDPSLESSENRSPEKSD